MMMNPCKIFPLFLLFFFNSLNATESFSNVFCGKMLDVENGSVRKHAMIGIDQDSGKIRSVEFNYPKTGYDDVDTLNLSDYFCLPGLIDMHTHISEDHYRQLVEYLTKTQQEQIAIGRENVEKTLLSGFTSVRDM